MYVCLTLILTVRLCNLDMGRASLQSGHVGHTWRLHSTAVESERASKRADSQDTSYP